MKKGTDSARWLAVGLILILIEQNSQVKSPPIPVHVRVDDHIAKTLCQGSVLRPSLWILLVQKAKIILLRFPLSCPIKAYPWCRSWKLLCSTGTIMQPKTLLTILSRLVILQTNNEVAIMHKSSLDVVQGYDAVLWQEQSWLWWITNGLKKEGAGTTVMSILKSHHDLQYVSRLFPRLQQGASIFRLYQLRINRPRFCPEVSLIWEQLPSLPQRSV